MASSGKKLLQRIRVPLGFLFGAVFLVFAKPTALLIAVGAAVGLIGLGIRAWASGHIRKNQELAISGPYRFTRNPLYLGSFILAFGTTVATGRWWLIVLFTVLFLGIYLPVMSVEAEELSEIFGDEYRDYSKKVPLFLPGFRIAGHDKKKFELSLYLRYREYRALLGFLLIISILAVKAYLGL